MNGTDADLMTLSLRKRKLRKYTTFRVFSPIPSKYLAEHRLKADEARVKLMSLEIPVFFSPFLGASLN